MTGSRLTFLAPQNRGFETVILGEWKNDSGVGHLKQMLQRFDLPPLPACVAALVTTSTHGLNLPVIFPLSWAYVGEKLCISWAYPCRKHAALMGLNPWCNLSALMGLVLASHVSARSIAHHADGTDQTCIGRGACMACLPLSWHHSAGREALAAMVCRSRWFCSALSIACVTWLGRQSCAWASVIVLYCWRRSAPVAQ